MNVVCSDLLENLYGHLCMSYWSGYSSASEYEDRENKSLKTMRYLYLLGGEKLYQFTQMDRLTM